GGSFFFQAEDGIRYFHVTGVQTCALPIYLERGIVVSGFDEILRFVKRMLTDDRRAPAGSSVIYRPDGKVRCTPVGARHSCLITTDRKSVVQGKRDDNCDVNSINEKMLRMS